MKQHFVKLDPAAEGTGAAGGAPAGGPPAAGGAPDAAAAAAAAGGAPAGGADEAFNIDKYINDLSTGTGDASTGKPGDPATGATGQPNSDAFSAIASQLEQQTQINQQLMQGMQSMQTTLQGLNGNNQQQSTGLNDVLQSLASNQQTLTQAFAGQQEAPDWMSPEQREKFTESAPVIENAAKHFSKQSSDLLRTEVGNQLTTELESRDKQINALSEQVKQANFNSFRMQVRQSHADLQTVLADPNWVQFQSELDPMSGYTRGEIFNSAVNRSDAETANNILGAYKAKFGSGQPANGANQFGAPGQQGNPAQQLGEQGAKFVRGQDQELLQKWQAKQIDDETFNKLFAAYEKAESAGELLDRR